MKPNCQKMHMHLKERSYFKAALNFYAPCVADLHRQILDPSPLAQTFFIFMQPLGKILPYNRLAPPVGNSGSAPCDDITVVAMESQSSCTGFFRIIIDLLILQDGILSHHAVFGKFWSNYRLAPLPFMIGVPSGKSCIRPWWWRCYCCYHGEPVYTHGILSHRIRS